VVARAAEVAVPPGWWQHHEVQEVTGTIRFLNIEGGCWAIDIGGRRVEPMNLDTSYRVDGLAVVATLRAENDRTTICDVGQMVSIVEIRKR
jgi:hypothetical protein